MLKTKNTNRNGTGFAGLISRLDIDEEKKKLSSKIGQ